MALPSNCQKKNCKYLLLLQFLLLPQTDKNLTVLGCLAATPRWAEVFRPVYAYRVPFHSKHGIFRISLVFGFSFVAGKLLRSSSSIFFFGIDINLEKENLHEIKKVNIF